MTQVQALDVFAKALSASHDKDSATREDDVALVTVEALEGIRVGLTDLLN
jgi:hypothetical protein